MKHLITGLMLASIWLITDASGSFAQKVPKVADKLPPPPPIPSATHSNTFNCQQSIPIQVIPPSSPVAREYVFQSPQTKPSKVPSRSPSASLYRVEVIGKDRELLSKVKKVEPLAFIRLGEGVIQAGLFQEQQQAQQRVRELKNNGFSARVISVNSTVRRYANLNGRR